jgi:hypothetical protein
MLTKFWSECLKGTAHSADIGLCIDDKVLDYKLPKMNLKETGYEGVDWINLDQNGDQWWTLMNVVN